MREVRERQGRDNDQEDDARKRGRTNDPRSRSL